MNFKLFSPLKLILNHKKFEIGNWLAETCFCKGEQLAQGDLLSTGRPCLVVHTVYHSIRLCCSNLVCYDLINRPGVAGAVLQTPL